MNRFDRQYILTGFGIEGQKKLKNASVLIVGAGGLGCPALLYLAAAGVGRIGVIDGDFINVTNLNRQVLFGEKDLGKNKAEQAVRQLRDKYSDITWEIFPEFLTVQNAQELIADYDLVIDGTDNFPTRYLINDACLLHGKPIVFGAIYQHEGQVSVFNLGENACNYRDVHPEMPGPNEIPNCSETGVLGVLPGIIGNLMALEAIKVLSGYGEPLKNRMLYFNSLTSQTYEVELMQKVLTSVPDSWTVLERTDYQQACGTVKEMTWKEAMGRMNQNVAFVDVRELDELPPLVCSGLMKIPMSVLDSEMDKLEDAEQILIFCQSGMRSQKAAQILSESYPDKKIFSIKGGINALKS
jgi:sulfur-carrier protein adenylyltransferase/sulfurtransferase